MSEHKDEVVISGIGGLFPECDNVDELKELLFSKTNGVTINSSRWKPNIFGTASGTGKMKNVDKFDARFFSAHPKLVEVMDALTRIYIERSVDAVIDAGLSPLDLHGTNTAVFAGMALSETEMDKYDWSSTAVFSMLGRSKTMQANRVSYILNLNGPSFTMDGGWLCGSNGLEKAKSMIENGIISAAIVGVTNLVLKPELQLQFQGINRLNKGDSTKSFSSNADGYNRSEACVVLFLQRASEAKRSYGTLVNVKSVQFGDHLRHIIDHNAKDLKTLLLDTYKEANIDPASVEFIEAYGSGIKSDDTMELNVMEEVFCTKQRKSPLKIGSVKSNVGHCEPTGFFMSIVKAIIALDGGYIPPNINYSEPNEKAKALKNGTIKVVTEKTPLESDIIGVSAFGLQNGFSHVILKRNNKIKNLNRIRNDNNLPRLILASGRTEKNALEAVKKIKSHGVDTEFLTLTNEVFTRNINAHFFRSFSIFPDLENTKEDEVYNMNFKKRPVWFVFAGMGSQWQGMGSHLMKIPIFAEAINKCDSILKPHGVDVVDILTNTDPKLFDNILNSFVGIAAVQIGLVEILKALDITPDGIVGHSVGELGCAYADGCFTAEEMILAAHARGRASLETDLIPGMMAAIGLGYQEIKDRLPHDIDVACRNSASSCTISGPVASINEFVAVLKNEGIFAKAVNVAGIAYHSRYIQSAGPTLLKYLKEVIKEPKLRSPKWISSSLPESEWNSDLAKYSSPEYHTNNLLSSVLFEDALKQIPSDAIAIEIAPHGLLQAILKGALPETVTNIPLTKRMTDDSVRFLLTAIGKLYANGLNTNIKALYPTISYPVSRGTPSINSLPFWDHTENWTPIILMKSGTYGFEAERTTPLILNDSIHLIEHQIYGHHIIPFSYILVNVWKLFVEVNGKMVSEEPIQFQNLWFKNNVKMHPNNSSQTYLMIQWGSGLFEYNIDNEVILSGQISFEYKTSKVANQISKKLIIVDDKLHDFQEYVSKDEIYTLLENGGYDLGENFKNISSLEIQKNNIQGHVRWENDWIYFLDGLLKFPTLEKLNVCPLETPVFIRQISITPEIIENNIEKNINVKYNTFTREISCAGIKISGVKIGPISLPKITQAEIKLEEESFVLFSHSKCQNINEFVIESMDIITEVDKLNTESTTSKLIVCTPYHYDDSVSKECTKSLKKTIENQITLNSVTLNWDNVKNISEDDQSGRFITVTNVNYLQDTIKAMTNKKCCYIMVSSKQELKELKDWRIITQQKFHDNNYLALLKKDIVHDKNIILIKQTDENYETDVWTKLKKYSSSEEIVYIVSKTDPLEGISSYVKKMLAKYQSQKLRFLFILDSKAPDFESNKLFYSNQLSKGLIVNIYKNGGWGSYRRIVLQGLKDPIQVTNKLSLENISNNSKVTINYLGLNMKDLVVEERTENEFGPLEYSGYTKNNKNIMGLAIYQQIASKIELDELLRWPVPTTWSQEDATTVPLAYALNYFIYNVLYIKKEQNSILITSGLHPIGQAAIAIGLSSKHDVYVIVNSSQEADHLSNIFPNLPRLRIIVNTDNKFNISIKMMTKGIGMNCIFNFLSGKGFFAALDTIALHGQFFNFSMADSKTQATIGLKIFLNHTSITTMTSSMLFNENNRNKQIVWQAFMDGLKEGVIKPFSKCVLKTPYNSNTLFDTVRTASAFDSNKKVVLPLRNNIAKKMCRENVKCDTYKCYSDQIYVIVGNKSDWLDVAEWLVDRGAQKIVIASKRCLMSSISCRRFDKLISRNVSVQIESDFYLNTREESVNWLNRLTSSNVLGSILMVNQLNNTKIDNLRYGFEESINKTKSTPFVCITSSAEHACAELKSIGFNALNVTWDEMSSPSNNISKILLSLDQLLQKSKDTESFSYICSDSGTEKSKSSQLSINNIVSNFFPESVDELHMLNKKITETAGFVEVSTRSPRFSHLKSVSPVFVIPGFKPKSIEILYKNFFYPVFEAQLPKEIISIDELATTLVNEINNITNQNCVSLIGESWGGIVALKMAQILEVQGTMVTVSLLEGDPEILNNWAERFLLNDNISNKLNSMYSSFSTKFSKYTQQNYEEETQPSSVTFNQELIKQNTKTTLNWIRSSLQALLSSIPLSNKLHTKVSVFRYERSSESKRINLNDYCINPPLIYIVPKTDYNTMLTDKDMLRTITQNVIHVYPNGIELSLEDKYKNYYYDIQKKL